MRKHSRPRLDRTVPLKLGTLKTVENAQNTADTKCSVSHVAKIAVISKGRCDSIRNGSFFRENKQSYISVNKTDCDTADTKQEHFNEISSNEVKNISNKMTSWKEHPKPAAKCFLVEMVRMTENGDD